MPMSKEWYEERFDDPEAVRERDCQRERDMAIGRHPALSGIFERSESERAEHYRTFAGLFDDERRDGRDRSCFAGLFGW